MGASRSASVTDQSLREFSTSITSCEGGCSLCQSPGQMAWQMALPGRNTIHARPIIHRRARGWIATSYPNGSGLVAASLYQSLARAAQRAPKKICSNQFFKGGGCEHRLWKRGSLLLFVSLGLRGQVGPRLLVAPSSLEV